MAVMQDQHIWPRLVPQPVVTESPGVPFGPLNSRERLRELRTKGAAAARLDAVERVTSLHTQVRCETRHIRG
jgi:hypothetical protein